MIRVKRKLSSTKVIDARTDLFILRSVPAYISSLSHRGVSTRSKHGLGRLFGQRPSLPSQTQSRLLRLSPALRRDHRVANPEGLNRIYEVSCLPLRPLQRKVLLLPITPQRRGRSGSPCLMIPETVRAILAAIGLYALRRKCLLWRSLAMERSNVSRKLLVLNKYRQNAHCTVSARVVCIQYL